MSLRALAEQISSHVGSSDDFADALVDAAPEVNQWLASCSPCDGCPPNPKTDATEAEQKAWIDAFTVQSSAKQATHHHQKMMAHHIKKRHRKDKTPISEGDAEALSDRMIEAAKTQSQEDIAASLMESRQSS